MAHPELKGYIVPFTREERLLHVREAKRTLGTKIPWLVDTMDNHIKHGLGNRPNSEFILDPDGKVAVKRMWSKPAELRKDLERLVGPIAHPTRIEDLDLKIVPPPKIAASGVVPRVPRGRGMQPLALEPKLEKKGMPFYVKLRAEAGPGLLKEGKGKLYLGFHLDPLYRVHWNNLTKPIKIILAPPKGVVLSSTELEGPKPKQESDIDPREFMLDATWPKTDQPLQLSVYYYACSDEEGWCKAVSQQYAIYLKKDRDGGRVFHARGDRKNRPFRKRTTGKTQQP